MRVLMISADRGLFGGGSSGDTVERHQKYANEAGHLDVVVFAGPSYTSVTHASNFHVFPSRSNKFTHWSKAFKVACKLTEEGSYDLIHVQDIAAPVGEAIKKDIVIPFTVSVHSMFFGSQWLRLNPVNWYLFWRLKQSMKSADGFRVNTNVIANKIRAWFPQVPILIQPTPSDISDFFTSEKSQNEIPVVLYVGRLSPEKNVGMLIKAVQSLEAELRLKIVGDGPERTKLEKLAAGDGRIMFLGAKAYNELPEIYKHADIFVLPSNTESFGKVLLEAGASKCAIVATNTAGASNILTNEKDALLTKVGDKEALQAALGRLILDEDLRASLGEGACKRARYYNSDEGIAKTVAFWKRIVENIR